MTNKYKLIYKLYGPQLANGHKVSPSVLGQKLVLLEKALKQTDKCLNGCESYSYHIKDLKVGSAEIVLEETPLHPLLPPDNSGIDTFQKLITEVSEGEIKSINSSGIGIIKLLKSLCKGVGKSFSHAEFGLEGKKFSKILIDKHFQKNVKLTSEKLENQLPNFIGTALESYDGELKEVDLRTNIPKAKLILFAARKELQCYCESIPIQTLRASLDKPVTVFAKATYEGDKRLPVRLDITNIEILKKPGKFSDWQGKFDLSYPGPEDIW